jgi:hypothetical protein
VSLTRPLLLVSTRDIMDGTQLVGVESPIHLSLERFFGERVTLGESLVSTQRYGHWILSMIAQQRLQCWKNGKRMQPFCFVLYSTDTSRLPDDWRARQGGQ